LQQGGAGWGKELEAWAWQTMRWLPTGYARNIHEKGVKKA